MLKHILFCLLLFIFSPLSSQIIAVRNVCVGTIVEVKTSDFTCAGVTTVPGISGNTADLPLFRSNSANRSTTIQLNKVGTYFFFLACSNNVTQRIQINFVDCDTAQCLGPNLVPNPSLETIANCVNPRISLTGVAANWLDYPILQGEDKGSVDFYHKLCAGGGFSGILDNNPPRTGNGMLGAFVFRQINNGSGELKNRFEYPVVPLTQPLVVGQAYRVRFYLKYPNSYSVADKISASFFLGDPNAVFTQSVSANGTVGYDYNDTAPKVSNPPAQFVSEPLFWTKVEGIITADKPYTHMIVGNLGGLSTTLTNVWSYYLFDDFLVQAVGANIDRRIINADTVVCKGQSATLKLVTNATKTSLKNLTNDEVTTVDTSRLITIPNVTQNGCYRLFFDKNGCRDSLSFCVKNYPNYDTLVNRFSCRPSDTGLIVRQLRTFRGCDSTVRIQTNLKLKDTTNAVQFVCNRADTGFALVKLKSTEGCDSFVLLNRKWVKADTTYFEIFTCSAKDAGLVVKKLINRFQCDSFVLIETKLFEPTLIDLGLDTAVDIGSRLKLTATLRGDSAKTILWQPPLGLSCTNCLTPELVVTQSVLLSLTVTNRGGCTSKAEKLVKAIDKPFVFVPNVFSPNGDNTNEILTVYANPNRVEMIKSFRIYNRWGNLVFSKTNFLPNDESAGWDGFFNGNKVNPNIFVYVVEFMLFDKQIKTVSGDVSVAR